MWITRLIIVSSLQVLVTVVSKLCLGLSCWPQFITRSQKGQEHCIVECEVVVKMRVPFRSEINTGEGFKCIYGFISHVNLGQK